MGARTYSGAELFVYRHEPSATSVADWLCLATRQPVWQLRDVEKDGFADGDLRRTNATSVPPSQCSLGNVEQGSETLLRDVTAAGDYDLTLSYTGQQSGADALRRWGVGESRRIFRDS
jgi:hypothetical protein